jgi:hypothetical protein
LWITIVASREDRPAKLRCEPSTATRRSRRADVRQDLRR